MRKGEKIPFFRSEADKTGQRALLDGETCRERSLGKGEVDAGRGQEGKLRFSGHIRTKPDICGVAEDARGVAWGWAGLVFSGCLVSCFRH